MSGRITRLAEDAKQAQVAIRAARAAARDRAWQQTGLSTPAGLKDRLGQVLLDLDATLVTAGPAAPPTPCRTHLLPVQMRNWFSRRSARRFVQWRPRLTWLVLTFVPVVLLVLLPAGRLGCP